MKKLSALLAGLLLSGSALATGPGCYNWGCYGKVSELYVNANGDVFVGTPFDESGPPDCSTQISTYFTLRKTATNFDAVLSHLMAAQLANKNVYIYILPGSAGCDVHHTITEG